ncbi:6-phospho-3-hexuloisomerase [Zophobihabitans entericus]|uniref:SIS domain-containing protein n=1 Tax=Zophobihabitans entericus TaxID=1635327 RepID=A0A6G9I9R4_9GAMM|nr:6-phospho-3-hexuloisomerase [Zophobihabitans entericus]QIQ20577.1 SIS domain-containing protein [Zophobihabitans entericus]
MSESHYSHNQKCVITELDTVLKSISEQEIEQLLQALLAAEKVFIIGVGRVKISLSAFAKRLNHLGIKTWLVGDVNEPPIGSNDLLLVGSGSGESLFPKNIAICAQKYHAKIAHLTSSPKSSIAQMADVIVDFHCNSKSGDGIKTIQPMTTLFEQALMIFGDLICLEIARRKGLTPEQVATQHANLE